MKYNLSNYKKTIITFLVFNILQLTLYLQSYNNFFNCFNAVFTIIFPHHVNKAEITPIHYFFILISIFMHLYFVSFCFIRLNKRDSIISISIKLF